MDNEKGPESGMKLDELDKALQNLGFPKWLSSRLSALVFILTLLAAGYLFLEREFGWHKPGQTVTLPAPASPVIPAAVAPAPRDYPVVSSHQTSKSKEHPAEATAKPVPSQEKSTTIDIGPGTSIQQKTNGDCSPAVVGQLSNFNCNTAPKPRVISEDDYAWMRQALETNPGVLRHVAGTMEPETMQLVRRLDRLFRDAGWTVKEDPVFAMMLFPVVRGVQLQFWGTTQMRIVNNNSMEIYSLTPPGAAAVALKHANIPMTVFLMKDEGSEELSLQVGPQY